MALTPEDVVNKRFQPTKFREGYDQDEVDDFLDEVVVELRRLNQENEELKQRLAAAESRVAELQRSGSAAPAEAAPAQAPEPAAAPAAPAATTAVPVVEPTPVDETQSTNNLLQLARRLHEEHVAEGKAKRDELIAEGHATAARLVAEAETKQKEQIAILEKERAALQSKIDELRTFERDYRAKLKSYIEGQLRDLEAQGAAAPATGSVPSGEGAQQPASSFQGFGA
ncbi:DivIVA domain-containing protein [Gryllotalpicola ginsengisoli]|uniref:DivIVA domain-containing protein n=1 Tax=Gryllotalpicola ginsengisoli TaxID=444608 RepID=UPI0003B30D47|nr:DivIVA domain-containing protein [Gryllotalpicola ginsengisoli]